MPDFLVGNTWINGLLSWILWVKINFVKVPFTIDLCRSRIYAVSCSVRVTMKVNGWKELNSKECLNILGNKYLFWRIRCKKDDNMSRFCVDSIQYNIKNKGLMAL